MSPESMKERFLEICKTKIHRDGIDELINWLERSDFFMAPASTKFHGSYESGLLEHSLDVYECLNNLVARYPSLNISEETVAICGLFHDLCKVNFYKKDKKRIKDINTGQWDTIDTYIIDEKFPIGHGEKSCIILQWFLKELRTDELLAIRYHMGGFDTVVKGGDFSMSKAYDLTPIAPMLHLADMESTYLFQRNHSIQIEGGSYDSSSATA